MSDELASVHAFRRTLQGIEAAEVVGAGCAWGAVLAISSGVAAAAAMWMPIAALSGALVAAVGAAGLWQIARVRTLRAASLLQGFDTRVMPTFAVPVRIPRAERTQDGVLRVWRVFGVREPDGRRITAEVAIECTMGEVWFVCWPAANAQPREAADLDLVRHPVVPGLLVASADVPRTQPLLMDPLVVQLLEELVGRHAELSVYPFGAWWRSKEPATRQTMRAAEARLLQLSEVLRSQASR